jgi:dihydrofolate reductase
MKKLIVFNHVTLDGYFVSANGDMNWARTGNEDAEYAAFVAANAGSDGQLLFGRITYDLMASYWPTPLADQHNPLVAKRMNEMPKVVFSRTMDKALWSNTKLVKGDLATEIRKLKAEPGPDMVILGSGNIIAQLAAVGLIDEYQMVVDPVVLGKGRTMFADVPQMLTLKLISSRTFRNGKVFLHFGIV